MNLSQFNNILRQVFLLPVVALLVVAGALYVQIRGANATVELIQDSDARISQATLVAKLVVDEESGLRGYETTGDPRFLQPFTDAESHAAAGDPEPRQHGWSRRRSEARHRRPARASTRPGGTASPCP